MIDMQNISRDFTPRRRPEEEGFTPQGGGMGQQPFTPPSVPPPQAPPGGGYGGYSPMQPPGGGMGVSTGQPQPFTPVGGQPPGVGPMQPPGGGGYRAIQPGEDPVAYQQEMAAGGTFIGQPQGGQPGGMPGAGQPGISVPPGGGGFPYPEQWGQAGDIYGQLAGGMPGMPDPQAMWGGYQQQAGDLSRELAEQAGMGVGSRYGSALQRNIADVGMRAGERFGGEMERMRMGDIAGQRQAMLGAAGGLSGLGGAQAMLPGQLAGQAMGLGGQYQGMQQQEYDRQMQEFMRTQPEYNPLLPYMQQGSQVPYGPQTYQPGFGSNMLDIGGMMGMYGMMGG